VTNTDVSDACPLILVVEDDDVVRESIMASLRLGGFSVRDCLERGEIIANVLSGSCAAMVLDIGLPGDDGVSIATEIRLHSNIPIIMLTGRAGIRDRVLGLEAGADDYLVKPFAEAELLARVRALLRRGSISIDDLQRPVEVMAQLGDARLDLSTRALVGPIGQEHLTERELRLIMALCRSLGPLSRQLTYRSLFQREWDAFDRSLDVHISNLRRKLKSVSQTPVVIANLRGEGYELRGSFHIETE
jgi:DNA-binding response OmpR family regulator